MSFYNKQLLDDFGVVFGTDCPRAYYDLISIAHDHYRIKVHPFLLIELQPIVLFFNAFLHSMKISAFLSHSVAGALSTIFLIHALVNFQIKKSLSYLLGIIYGLSFSSLIFTSVPETYIFGGMFNSLFLYYLSNLYLKKQPLNLKNYLFISVLMVLNFGIIPVNLLSDVILLVWVMFWIYKNNKEKILPALCKIAAITLILYFAFTFIQKIAYPNSPIFFKEAYSEDIKYTHLETNFEKLKFPLRGMFVESLYSTRVNIGKYIFENGKTNLILYFDHKQNFIHFVPAIIFLSIPFIFYFIKFKKYKKRNSLIFVLLSILILNFIQFYYYGFGETFLYTQNFLCYLILLLALLFNEIDKNFVTLLCLSLIGYQIVVNCGALIKMLKAIQNFYANGQFILCVFKSLAYSLITTSIFAVLIGMYNKFVCSPKTDKWTFYLGSYLTYMLVCAIFAALFKGAI